MATILGRRQPENLCQMAYSVRATLGPVPAIAALDELGEALVHVVDGVFGPVAVAGEDPLERVTGIGEAGERALEFSVGVPDRIDGAEICSLSRPGHGVAGEEIALLVDIQDAPA